MPNIAGRGWIVGSSCGERAAQRRQRRQQTAAATPADTSSSHTHWHRQQLYYKPPLPGHHLLSQHLDNPVQPPALLRCHTPCRAAEAAQDKCEKELPTVRAARNKCIGTDLPAARKQATDAEAAQDKCEKELPVVKAARNKCIGTDLPAANKALA